MNISLSKAKSKKKKSLSYGLNAPTRVPAGFGGDDDDDDDDDSSNSDEGVPNNDGRSQVNRDLRAEQEALRKRAEVALQKQNQPGDIYDYDGAYDSFRPQPQEEKQDSTKEPKKSRYVADLLKVAKRRERERDMIYERKIAKEQAAEDAEHGDKERFVTKAYKRKLAERELWAQEEAAREEQEKNEDVTKKTGDAAMASFYGNLNRNVAMGGQSRESGLEGVDGDKRDTVHGERVDPEPDRIGASSSRDKLGFMEGFERAAPPEESSEVAKDDAAEEELSPEDKELAVRKAREEKVARARLRYFKRKGISEDAALQKQ